MLRRLESLVENQQVPSEDPDLAFLTRLLQLAVGCRAMLRNHKSAPHPPLLPLIVVVLNSGFGNGSMPSRTCCIGRHVSFPEPVPLPCICGGGMSYLCHLLFWDILRSPQMDLKFT